MRARDEHKEAIVKEKALEMLVIQGFDGFSMQKLAKAASVSPATLYIYYKDKDDLIVRLGIDEGRKMTDATFFKFDPSMSFDQGMRVQWKNRSSYWLQNPISARYVEQIKHSPYREKVVETMSAEFKEVMGQFVRNAVINKELVQVSIETYWTIAFAPLYNLLRFHQEGKSMGNRDFTFNEEVMNETLELVLKALKP